MDIIYQIDLSLFRWFNSRTGISAFWDFAIVLGATYLWYAVITAILLLPLIPRIVRRYRHAALRNTALFLHAASAAFVARYIVTEIIRYFYNRPRPFEVLSDAIQLVAHAGGGSFPSGHAALAFAVAAAVGFYYPKTSILFFLAAVGIGVGRVAAGVHWPSDILGGAIIGISTAWVLGVVLSKVKSIKPADA